MIPLRRLFLVGMMLGTSGWDNECEPHLTIKKSLIVYWNSCESDQAVRLEELFVAVVFGLKERREGKRGEKGSGHRGLMPLHLYYDSHT